MDQQHLFTIMLNIAFECYSWKEHSVNYRIILIIWPSLLFITYHLRNTHCCCLNLLCLLSYWNTCYLYHSLHKYQRHLQNSYIGLHLQLQIRTILSLWQLYSICRQHQCALYSCRPIDWRFLPVKATVRFSSIPREWTVGVDRYLRNQKKSLISDSIRFNQPIILTMAKRALKIPIISCCQKNSFKYVWRWNINYFPLYAFVFQSWKLIMSVWYRTKSFKQNGCNSCLAFVWSLRCETGNT